MSWTKSEFLPMLRCCFTGLDEISFEAKLDADAYEQALMEVYIEGNNF